MEAVQAMVTLVCGLGDPNMAHSLYQQAQAEQCIVYYTNCLINKQDKNVNLNVAKLQCKSELLESE